MMDFEVKKSLELIWDKIRLFIQSPAYFNYLEKICLKEIDALIEIDNLFKSKLKGLK